jgi:hypothetical protein
MSRAEKAPLLEILVARDEGGSHSSHDSGLRLEPTALSFTAGVSPKYFAKKGILKRGATLRRASSFTAGGTSPSLMHITPLGNAQSMYREPLR